MSVAEKAELLRRLHHGPAILVLPNAWDVASAVALAAVPGVRALATTSAGVARSLGFEDGEQAPREEMVRMASRIAAAVPIPVTADLEAGYGDPVGTALRGLGGRHRRDQLRGLARRQPPPVEEQASLIREIRTASPELVLNARVDVFIRGVGDVDEAVERGNAYLAAGADCVYPIACPADSIAELASGSTAP